MHKWDDVPDTLWFTNANIEEAQNAYWEKIIEFGRVGSGHDGAKWQACSVNTSVTNEKYCKDNRWKEGRGKS